MCATKKCEHNLNAFWKSRMWSAFQVIPTYSVKEVLCEDQQQSFLAK